MITLVVEPAEFSEVQRAKLVSLFAPIGCPVKTGETVRVARPIKCSHLPGKDYILCRVIEMSESMYITDDEYGFMVLLDNLEY